MKLEGANTHVLFPRKSINSNLQIYKRPITSINP